MGLDRLDVTMLIVAVVNVLVILELVRRRRLHEKYALLWLSVGGSGSCSASAGLWSTSSPRASAWPTGRP